MISNVKGIEEINAFLTTDGKKFLELSKAETRQKIINNGDKPCDKCECTGQFYQEIQGLIGGYTDTCKECNGHGFLKLQYTKLPLKLQQ